MFDGFSAQLKGAMSAGGNVPIETGSNQPLEEQNLEYVEMREINKDKALKIFEGGIDISNAATPAFGNYLDISNKFGSVARKWDGKSV
ncbi:hypothetical protein AX774_g539 [Zancudomyces culisetae]|uniref:Uncharacterized protein n=1 Tax=Zancudomyces culisetae TaxID=1213189 RepID=A0A1R1PY52_ZANCU|nr:hypothetical protein AX774_g539 [Zancudomyces culisetae]|eukprot:OMH85894.1 hypothetical protein AX774_g539 [Zancudomyces culisetae]